MLKDTNLHPRVKKLIIWKTNCIPLWATVIGLHIMSANSKVNTLRSKFSLEVVCIQISIHNLDFQKLWSAK